MKKTNQIVIAALACATCLSASANNSNANTADNFWNSPECSVQSVFSKNGWIDQKICHHKDGTVSVVISAMPRMAKGISLQTNNSGKVKQIPLKNGLTTVYKIKKATNKPIYSVGWF